MTNALDVATVYISTFAPQTDKYQLWRSDQARWDPVKDDDGRPVDKRDQVPDRSLPQRRRPTAAENAASVEFCDLRMAAASPTL